MTFVSDTIKFAKRWFGKDSFFLVKIAIICGVLFSGFYLAPRIVVGGHRYPTLLFLAYLGAVSTVVFLLWPILGLILVIIGGIFVPYVGPGGFNIAQIGAVFLLVIWLLDMMIRQKKISLVKSEALKPIFFFLIISILAFGLGQLPWYVFAQNAPFDAQLGGFVLVVLSVGLFLVVANLCREIKWLQALTWIFIGLGAIYIIGRLLGLGIQDQLYNRGFSAQSMFWTWLMALTFSQFMLNPALDRRWRALLGLLVIGIIYVAYFQAYDWKSGWLPPLISIGAILGVRYWRQARYLLILTVIPVWNLISQAISTDQYSWGTRIDAWLIVTEITKVNPILGMGFANYYWYTPLIPIRGYAVSFNSHSQFVDLFAEMGVLGLIGFLWIFWELGKLGLRLRVDAPDGFQKAYVYGVLGGLAGTLVAAALVDWVIPFVYNIGMNGFRGSMIAWIFMGGLVALEQIINKQNHGA